MSNHISVLTQEVLVALNLKPQGTYLDATVGSGGHTRAILEAEPTSSVIGLDRDPAAIEALQGFLAAHTHRLTLVHSSYAGLQEIAAQHGIEGFDGIIADLGFSSVQLGDASRGFSFDLPGPLDLRFDRTQGEPASSWLRRQSVTDLASILGEFGDFHRPHQLADKILMSIEWKSEIGTQDLVEASGLKTPKKLAKLFQAVRIAVNDELGILERALPNFLSLLIPGGHLLIISFHSGEDRLVKHMFRAWQKNGAGRILTKRPIRPTEEEVIANRRAKSAKLRIFERKEDLRADDQT